MEKEVGSIVPGKLANFTILADNPVTTDPMKIKDIAVWGTVHEGRVLPVKREAPARASALVEAIPAAATELSQAIAASIAELLSHRRDQQ
jgi:Amidohydrolase family